MTTYTDACEQTLARALQDGVIEGERDAFAIETMRGLARQLDEAESQGKGFAQLANSLKAWWPVLIRPEDQGDAHTIGDFLAAAVSADASAHQQGARRRR